MSNKSKKTNRRKLLDRKRRRKKVRRLIIIGLVAVVAIFAVGYTFRPKTQAPSVSEARLADNPSQGNASAPVTITEFGNFGCHACREWHLAGILDQIRLQYGDQVRIVWRDFPIITAQSPKAAEAGQCAYDQGLFWEYHDSLFENAPRLSVGQLKGYAEEVGMNRDEFDLCLDSGQHAETVDLDLRAAFQRGLRGTPSFLVNDQLLIGGSPQTMIQMIEANLNQ